MTCFLCMISVENVFMASTLKQYMYYNVEGFFIRKIIMCSYVYGGVFFNLGFLLYFQEQKHLFQLGGQGVKHFAKINPNNSNTFCISKMVTTLGVLLIKKHQYWLEIAVTDT